MPLAFTNNEGFANNFVLQNFKTFSILLKLKFNSDCNYFLGQFPYFTEYITDFTFKFVPPSAREMAQLVVKKLSPLHKSKGIKCKKLTKHQAGNKWEHHSTECTEGASL